MNTPEEVHVQYISPPWHLFSSCLINQVAIHIRFFSFDQFTDNYICILFTLATLQSTSAGAGRWVRYPVSKTEVACSTLRSSSSHLTLPMRFTAHEQQNDNQKRRHSRLWSTQTWKYIIVFTAIANQFHLFGDLLLLRRRQQLLMNDDGQSNDSTATHMLAGINTIHRPAVGLDRGRRGNLII